MLFPPGPRGVGDRGEGVEAGEEAEEEEEEGWTRPFCVENERALPVCCEEEEEEEGSLRDPLDREGMCEAGRGSEPERAGNMEDLVTEEEEELALLVAWSGADWEPLVELG